MLFEDLDNNRSNALKAWLIVYREGLQDPLRKILLKNGCEPFEEKGDAYIHCCAFRSY